MTVTKNERGYWEVRVKGPDGRIKTRSTGERVREAADRVIRDARIKEMETASRMRILSQEVASVLLTGSSPMTVEQALKPWAEHMAYRSLSERTAHNFVIWIKAWAKSCQSLERPVGAIKLEDLNGWLNSSSTRKLSTRNVMLSALKSFCSFCRDSGWMAGNPANLLRVDMSKLLHEQKETLKRHCFTEEEVQKLIEGTAPGGICPDPFWQAAIIIGRYTGLRMGDICALEWDCLDIAAGTLNVWTQKRDRRVSLKLEPEVFAETMAELEHAHPVYLFDHQRCLSQSHECRYILSKQFTDVMRACFIEPCKTFHCLRSAYVTDCSARGIPMEHIARSVGHSDPKMTERYIRPEG